MDTSIDFSATYLVVFAPFLLHLFFFFFLVHLFIFENLSEEHCFYYEQSKSSKAPNITAVLLFWCIFLKLWFMSPARLGKLCLEGPDGLNGC